MTNTPNNIETLSDADCDAIDGGVDYIKSWDFTGTVGSAGVHLDTSADPIDAPLRAGGLLGQVFGGGWHR